MLPWSHLTPQGEAMNWLAGWVECVCVCVRACTCVGALTAGLSHSELRSTASGQSLSSPHTFLHPRSLTDSSEIGTKPTEKEIAHFADMFL